MKFIDGGSYSLNADRCGDSCPGIVGTFTSSAPPELNFSLVFLGLVLGQAGKPNCV